ADQITGSHRQRGEEGHPERRLEVLDQVEFLRRRSIGAPPRANLEASPASENFCSRQTPLATAWLLDTVSLALGRAANLLPDFAVQVAVFAGSPPQGAVVISPAPYPIYGFRPF